MKGNRYGLVGFGGSGVHDEATMHTIHGQQFGGIREMVRSLSSLEFKDGQNTDTLSSIRYAARYPFRAGVSKTIVLLTCNHCGEQEVKYDELLHVMNENEIRLHILREEEFKMSEKQTTPHSAYLFGTFKQHSIAGETCYCIIFFQPRDLNVLKILKRIAIKRITMMIIICDVIFH